MSARDRIHAMFPICDSPTEAEQRETDLDQRLDEHRIEVLAKAGVKYEDCPVCGAAFSLGKSCGTCDFRARMAAEAGEKASAPAPTATPTTDATTPAWWPADWDTVLDTAIRTEGGDWDTKRVQRLYLARYGRGLFRSHARDGLSRRAHEGLLDLDDRDANHRVYRLSTRKDVRP
jgi:hypothetical protein